MRTWMPRTVTAVTTPWHLNGVHVADGGAALAPLCCSAPKRMRALTVLLGCTYACCYALLTMHRKTLYPNV